MLQNLEQKRALHALDQANSKSKEAGFKGENGGKIVKDVPAMIQRNGLLGTMAFAMDEKKEGYKNILMAAIEFYGKEYNPEARTACGDLESFFKWVCSKDSATLRTVTAEIQSYLEYLRRFVKPEKSEDRDNAGDN